MSPAFIVNNFPFIILTSTIISFFYPGVFTWFSGSLITLGLGIIMLGMGLTLSIEDFKGIIKYPKLVLLGMILQYTIMPLSGWACAHIFNLPNNFAAGLILVSCCPGGTASNVITYIAQANLPLSVTMTALSTFMAVIFTPLLSLLFIGKLLEVNVITLFTSTVQVIILPIIAGLLFNKLFPLLSLKVSRYAPVVSVIFIALIVSSIVGEGKNEILSSGLRLVFAVLSLHSLGFLFGYILSKLISKNEIASRTISIEVGMQNSGLGVVLARQNFTDPLVAIPSAISSLFHSLIASILAAYWRRSADKFTPKL